MADMEQSARDKAKARLDKDVDKVAKQFLDAALGRAKFRSLDPKTRAAMLVKAMEWGLGRPNTGKPIVEEKDEQPEVGIVFE